MKIRLKRYEAKERLRHEDYNQLCDLIERLLNFTVDGSTGLQFQESSVGSTLSLVPDQTLHWAKTTSMILARSGGQDGKGTVLLHYIDRDDEVMKDYGYDEVEAYNNTGSDIDPDVWCIVGRIGWAWAIIEADCSGIA